MTRRATMYRLSLAATACLTQASLAQISVYADQSAFLAATGASSATGPLPDLGMVVSAAVGTITFSVAPGGDNLAIGGAGVAGLPTGDWYETTPGNDLAMGFEHLRVETAAPVYALGFDLHEPDATMPSWGGSPQDSTFRVTLFNSGAQVAQFTFNVDDDVAAFVGVWSATAFDSATIDDITGGIFEDDDEYFGEFYTGDTPLTVACYANCDESSTPPILNVNDFICFQTKYAAGDPYANCDGSTVAPILNVNDFICFQTQFAAGCP